MKDIRLNKLDLTNFMGFRGDFTFEPNGQDATISGKNRAGKTTIASGFSYLLFGKDLYGNSENQFSLKTKDENGRVIEMVDHIVGGTLSVDGQPLILKRNYRETRNKKNRKLTGHTTDFWIDGEPDIKKKDYDAQIAEIISFDLFKLLTSVTAFADLPWKVRREQLFHMCGDIKEDTLAAAEKAKKILDAKKREIAKKKDGIPPRIDEKDRDLAALAAYDRPEIDARVAKLEKRIQTIKTDSGRAALLKQQAELEADLSQLRTDQAKKQQEATSKIRTEINMLEDSNAQTRRVIGDLEYQIKSQAGIVEANTKNLALLSADWDNLEKTQPKVTDTCPTCKQLLPIDQVEAAKAELNQQKSEKFSEINHQGKKIKGEKARAETEKIKLEADLKLEKTNGIKIAKALGEKQVEFEKILNSSESLAGAKEAGIIRVKLLKINMDLQKDPENDTTALEVELRLDQARIAKLDTIPAIEARKEELKAEEKSMAAKIEELEKELFLSEEKLAEEARRVEEAVNNKFGVIKFKLFKEHLNTAIDPCCQILINGNEYGHGTSTSEEIRGGMDFIRVLSEFYGVSCPLFLDRAESVTDPLPKMTNQIIKLLVDEKCENLDIILDE